MSEKYDPQETKLIVGWREWVALPQLGIPAIKAKVDTGARTSTLHAYFLKTFREDGRDKLRFGIHPLQKRKDVKLLCVADIHDRRLVSDSGGHREMRYVIETLLHIGSYQLPVEMTLTNRDTMQFRMLIGRTAMDGLMRVDPSLSYLTGRSFRTSFIRSLRKQGIR